MGTPLDPVESPAEAPDTPEAISAQEEFDRIADAIDALPLADDSGAAIEEVAPEDQAPLGKTQAFDFTTNRFYTSGGKGPLPVTGVVGLQVWIEKCLRTARGAHPIYSHAYGLENPWDIIGQPLATISVADLESRVRDALVFHPRIVDVTNFATDTDEENEALFLTFTVVLDDETLLSVRNLGL